MIEVRHLSKSFDGIPVLKDINLHIDKGEVVTIIGPSGSGKSTLLRCLNLLEKPDGGSIVSTGRIFFMERSKLKRSASGPAWFFSISICSGI